jgi:CHAT domain-containing protein/tetratricopeptide (TPR) repeat protein
MSSRKQHGFVATVLLCLAGLGHAVVSASAPAGPVVDEVLPGGAAADVGLHSGDVVVRWERGTAGGRVDSPFELVALEVEQAGRPGLVLTVRRDGQEITLELGPSEWRVTTRPGGTDPRCATDDGEQVDHAVDACRAAALGAAESGRSDAAAWLLMRAGDALVRAGETSRADEQLGAAAAAAAAADRPWVRVLAARELTRVGAADLAAAALAKALQEVAPADLHAAAVRRELGLTAMGAGELATAAEHFEAALQLRMAAAPDGLAVAASEMDLGSLHRRRGDLDGADALLGRALARQERLAPGSLEVARCLTQLAMVEWARGELDRSEAQLEQAWSIAGRRDPGGMDAARIVNNRGILAYTRGDLDRAEELWLDALERYRASGAGGRDVARVLNNLGGLAYSRGDLVGAEDAYREALEVNQRLAPASLSVAANLDNLGLVARRRGDLAGAEDLHRRSLAVRRDSAPGSVAVASGLVNLGLVLRQRFDLARAEELYREAAAIIEKLAPSSLDLAISLTNLGNLMLERGDLEGAEARHRRALELREQLAPGSLDVAQSLINLGVVAREGGRLAEAESLLQRALRIQEQVAPSSQATAATVDAMGTIALARGDLAAAAGAVKRGLEIRESTCQRCLPVAESLTSMAAVHAAKGDGEVALELHQRALAVREELAPGSALVAGSHHDIGCLLRDAGELEAALQSLRRAVHALEQQAGRLGGGASAAERFSERFADVYRDLVELESRLGRTDQAFATLERYRARALLELLTARDLRFPLEVAGPGAEALVELGAGIGRAEAVVADPDRGEDRAAHVAERERLREQRRAALDGLPPRLVELLAPRLLDRAGVARALDPGVLLLTYCVGERGTQVFAVLGDRLEHFTIDRTRREIAAAVRAVRLRAARPDSGRAALEQRSRELYSLLVEPAEGMLRKAHTLLVCPDGPLHLLPFAALMRADGRYLIEHRPVALASSATVHAELVSRRRGRRATSVVAFADPELPQAGLDAWRLETLRSRLRDVPLVALPAARAEAAALTRLFPDRTTTFIGGEATEERARALSVGTSLVHFACHAFVDEQAPLSSGLLLAVPVDLRGRQDGVLEAWEVFESVRLDADLVTLSGCDTGLGRHMGGEGMVGLTRAFLFAGARSVLASLWTVADESTAALMERFYAHLEQDGSPAAALRAAQLELMSRPVEVEVDGESVELDFSHPFRWAAFQVYGDWR